MPEFKGVLVTGGAGFIGSHIVDALLERGERVTILDNLTPKIHPRGETPDYVPADARFVRGDVRERQAWLTALEGCDAVIHLAAYQDYNLDFSTFFAVNSVSTALLFELVVEGGLPMSRIVVASSQAVYGEGVYRCSQHGAVRPGPRPSGRLDHGAWEQICPLCSEEVTPEWATETDASPANQYGLSKLDQEAIGLVLGRLHGIPVAALRYSIVQGARQSPHNTYSGALRTFTIQAAAGRAPILFEDGRQLRDYVNIADAVAATLLVLEAPDAVGRAFNVGGGGRIPVCALAESVVRALGRTVEVRVPGLYRVGDTRHVFSSTSRLESIGWKRARTLDDSVREYTDWFMARYGAGTTFDDALEPMLRSGVVRRRCE